MVSFTSVPSPASPDAIVQVTLIKTGTLKSNLSFFTDPALGHVDKPYEFPVYSFHLMKDGKNYLFDLGLRADIEGAVQQVREKTYKNFSPNPINTLPASLPPALLPIDTVFPSHKHWDHMGNPLAFPSSTKFLVGEKTLASVEAGDPIFDKTWIEQRHFKEIIFSSGESVRPIGAFERGIDWFGDGSFWLIDAPGHVEGHMVALCRTTVSPPTYVLLCGDACHLSSNYRCPCSSHSSSTSLNPLAPQMHIDLSASQDTVSRVVRMNEEANVMVLLAHEVEAEGIVSDGAGDVNRWFEKGWKAAKDKVSATSEKA